MKTPTKKQVEKFQNQSIDLLKQNGYNVTDEGGYYEAKKTNQNNITHTIRFFKNETDFDLRSTLESDKSSMKLNYVCCGSNTNDLTNMIGEANQFTEVMFGDKRNNNVGTKKFFEKIFEK